MSLCLVLMLGFAPGCSRSQKHGASVSAQDLAKAMPEFTFTLPPGGTNLFFESDLESSFPSVYYKVTVPRDSVSNFLWTSRVRSELLTLPGGIGIGKSFPLPQSFDVGGAMDWAKDVNLSAEWDVYQIKGPLRTTLINTPSTVSPEDRVILGVYVNDAAGTDSTIYFEYRRLPKRFFKK